MIKLRPAAVAAAAALTLVLGAGTVAGSAAAAPTTPQSPAVPAAAKAPQTRAPNPSGDIAPIHDPALTVDRGVWYVFSTGYVHREQGGTIRIATSHDHGRTWKASG